VTVPVVTVNVAALLPPGTVTLSGTVAAVLPLESVTAAPPTGAAPLTVTVPTADEPAARLAGFNVSAVSVTAGGGGVTVKTAFAPPPLIDAEMVAVCVAVTALVATVNVALVAPAGTFTKTCVGFATTGWVLLGLMFTPPAGAGPLRVAVATEAVPPTILAGFKASELTVTAGGGVGWVTNRKSAAH